MKNKATMMLEISTFLDMPYLASMHKMNLREVTVLYKAVHRMVYESVAKDIKCGE